MEGINEAGDQNGDQTIVELSTVRQRNNAELKDVELQADHQLNNGKDVSNENGSLESFLKNNKKPIRWIGIVTLNLSVLAFFGVCLWYHLTYNQHIGWEFCYGIGNLTALLVVVYSFLIYFLIVKRFFGRILSVNILKPIYGVYKGAWSFSLTRLSVYLLVIATIITFIAVDTLGETERLVSLTGVVFLLLCGFVFSAHRSSINWRTVVWGLLLQFTFGILTIRWDLGRSVFQCLGDKVATFLGYGREGAAFVFGDRLVVEEQVFAFSSLPIIFFFSAIVEVLQFWGALQWFCLKLGWLLQVITKTTVCESVIAVANTFLGMTESPLLIKPYISMLTESELHLVMASGFATVSGTILAAYISFGANPTHLITASVMSAPAAICYAKLLLPEVQQTKTSIHNIETAKSEDTSALSAATRGATTGISLILNVIANLVAFVSIIAFVNGLLGFGGGLLGFSELNLEWIFGKIFIPLSWMLGVPWEECETVATLIGLKTVVNEFVAYQRLGLFKEQGLLSARGEAIATYALCGFTNPSSGGILIGALSAIAPNQRATLSKVVVRAFFAGCAICFMNACFAGLLMPAGSFLDAGNTTLTNMYLNGHL